jgi:copper type II ascorbate-dependent monooxygenase-like protein
MEQSRRMPCARSTSFALLVLAIALGCSKEEKPAPPAPPPPAKVAATYQDPIAGILERHCVQCHAGSGTEGSVPPKLTTYESASSIAKFAALVTARRKMPPWGADDTGLCGSYQDSHWLEPQEVAAFDEWAKAGAPRGAGEPVKPPPPPKAAQPPGTLSLNVESAAYAPAVGAAATRCFLIEAPLAADTFLTGVELSASPVHAVRQAELHALDTPEQVAAARRLEAEDSEPGWACYGGSRVPAARRVGSWSWSVPAQTMPAGSGPALHAGTPLVLQVRYNVKGSGFSGRAVTAKLQLATHTGAKAAHLLALNAQGFRLQPEQRQTEIASELTVSEPLALHGIMPRMHTLGRTLNLERLRGNERTCLAHFGHWDVYEAQLFRYRSPFELSPGDRVRLVCVYDTTSHSKETAQGESIDDEECAAELYVVPR